MSNESGWDAGERWLWDQELARDPGYFEWLRSIEAMASNEQERKDNGNSGERYE